MSVARPERSSLTVEGLWEAVAFFAPIALFGLLASVRIVIFVDTHNPVALLNAFGLAVLTSMFVIRKPAREVDRSLKSLAAALVGNFLPFAYLLHNETDWAGRVPLVIEVVALAFAIWTVLSLRASMGITPANRGVKTGGPYRFIRHPLYVCVIVSQVGLLLEYPHPANFVILATAIVFKGFMIRNEERVLLHDPAYVEYAKRVKYRAIPGII